MDLGELGRELDLSMTALREALKVLAAKGLVGARQKRGTFVLDRSQWNLLDGDVLRWRSEDGDTATVLRYLAELDAALVDAAAAEGTDAEVAADLRWHRALLAATHNELFAHMDVFIEPALRLCDSLVHSHPAHDLVPDHARVVAAIQDGDPGAATAAICWCSSCIGPGSRWYC